jgi:hypothetical protein
MFESEDAANESQGGIRREVVVDAFGIESARCSTSMANLPRISPPGEDEWRGPTFQLIALARKLRALTTEVRDPGKKIDRERLASEMATIQIELEKLSNDLLEYYSELVHIAMQRAQNPEMSGLGRLLPMPSDSSFGRISSDRKRKPSATPNATTRPRKSALQLKEDALTVRSVLSEPVSATPDSTSHP